VWNLRDEQEAQRQEGAAEVAGEARTNHAPCLGTAHALPSTPEFKQKCAGIARIRLESLVNRFTSE
jgi:hypothetical protein